MTETMTGAPARNYVGGEWRESASGETYEKRSPWRPSEVAGGIRPRRPRTRVPRSRPRARRSRVAALPAGQRAVYFAKAAAAIEARAEQVAQDMTAEMGKPLREARLETLRAATILRYAAGEAYRPIGEMYEPSVADQRCSRSAAHSGWSASSRRGTSRSRSRCGSSRRRSSTATPSSSSSGYEAPRTGLHVAECFAEAGLPGGVLNVLTGSRLEGRRRDRLERGRAGDLVHGLGAGRPVRARRGDRPRLPRPARARRAQPADRDGGRGARPCGRGDIRGGLLVGRAEVHRDAAHPRRGAPSTTRSATSCSRASRPARSGIRQIPKWRSGPW